MKAMAMNFYYDGFDSEQAYIALLDKPEGTYLLRKCWSSPGNIAISYKEVCIFNGPIVSHQRIILDDNNL